MPSSSLMDKIVEKNIALSASLELTHSCNLRCVMCYQCLQQGSELSTDEVKNILDQLAEAGCLYLSFTGGEPLLRQDFWEVAEHAKKRAFALILQTNGTLIDSYAASKIKELNFLQVHISILGATAKTHDKITQVEGSFEKAIAAAECLVKRKVNVVFKTTLMKDNFSEYIDIWDLTAQIGAEPYFSPVVFPKINGDNSPLKHKLSDDQLIEFISSAFPRSPDLSRAYATNGMVALCQMGKTDCCINPKGEVYPCVGLPLVSGSLREDKFSSIWNNSPVLDNIRTLDPQDLEDCSECELASICMRCPALGFLEKKGILGAPSECCRMTKIIKEVISNGKG